MGFVPDEAEILYLSNLPGETAFSPWKISIESNTEKIAITSRRDSHPFTPAPPEAPNPSSAAIRVFTAARPFPPVERGSQQLEGETMDRFFLRRKEHNAKVATLETADQRQRREQREAHALKGQAPGRRGARVYTWERSNGHYIRSAAGRQNYDDVWEEYGPEQRRYDSYHDEWDCCEEFGPPTEPGDDGDDEGVQVEPAELEPGEVITSETRVSTSVKLIAPTFKEMVYLRFGCTVAKDKNIHTDLLLPTTIVTKKFLGDSQLVISNDAEWNQFRAFLAHCKEAKTPHEIPEALLDFHQEASELYEEWTVSVRRERLNDRPYYVFSEKHESGLYILVERATDALEIVRQGWGPDLRDIMENLLTRGMTFLTCCRFTQCSMIPSSRPSHRRTGLGYRPLKYKPNLTDYAAYVSLRDNFFQSPRGRAALMYGGIIGRLARAEAYAEDVFRGPSGNVLIDGICLWDGRSRSAYWDDALTQDEIDLICGVYHVATG
ncbi:hypothetical protein C8R43DRAFT_910075 [Mycena crocata]|nr:hypothetical protein C8R43DRAFT_910075 [Mycena crocata]